MSVLYTEKVCTCFDAVYHLDLLPWVAFQGNLGDCKVIGQFSLAVACSQQAQSC